MCAKSGIYYSCEHDYGKDNVPHESKEIIEYWNRMQKKISLWERIHPLVMGDVMCNEKQPKMGGYDAPFMIGMPLQLVAWGSSPACVPYPYSIYSFSLGPWFHQSQLRAEMGGIFPERVVFLGQRFPWIRMLPGQPAGHW